MKKPSELGVLSAAANFFEKGSENERSLSGADVLNYLEKTSGDAWQDINKKLPARLRPMKRRKKTTAKEKNSDET